MESMVEYFNVLSEHDVAEFEKYVYSPYFNTHKSLVTLFNYLLNLYPAISKKHLTKEAISLAVFGEAKPNDANLRKLLSNFTKLMEDFFAQQEIDKRTRTAEIHKLEALRKRNLSKRFMVNYSGVSSEMSKSFSKDREYYQDMISLENEFHYFNFGKTIGSFSRSLQSKSDNLDYLFAFAKLHAFNEMMHSEGIKNKGRFYDRKFLNEILSFVENDIQNISENHPNLYIIYNVFKMFDTLEVKYFEKLQKYLSRHSNEFSAEKLSYYYHYITMFCVQMINLGHAEYNKRAFENYSIMARDDLFSIDKVINDSEFNNVVNIALNVGEFAWLNDFIEKFKDQLAPQSANQAYNLAMAKLNFVMKKYDAVFPYLNELEFKDPYYYTNSKYLLGRVYYELGSYESARYIILNLKQYQRLKNSLTPEQSDGIKNFNRYLGELLNLVDASTAKKRSKRVVLYKQIQNEEKFVPAKAWFTEKLISV